MTEWGTENIKVETVLDTSPNTYMQRTIDALNKGSYEDALENAKMAVRYGKGELVYYVLLVRVLFKMERYAVCLKFLIKSGLWEKRDGGELLPDEKKYLRYVYRVCCQKCNCPVPDDLYKEEENKTAQPVKKKQISQTQKSEPLKKKITVPKKEQKIFHTKRNLLISSAFIAVALVMMGVFKIDVDGNGISFMVMSIGMLGFIITAWFAFLRLIYKQATTARLWHITFDICCIVLAIILSFTGVGLIVTPKLIARGLLELIPTNDDLGLEEIEVDVKPVFDNAAVIRSQEITEADYKREIGRT